MYISRTLLLKENDASSRYIDQRDLVVADLPLVLLGEPGIGKSDLTRTLATALPATRVEAGQLSRAHDLAALGLQPGAPLIIDGLDEVTASAGVTAFDTILRQLSALGRPPFILSCRSLDWQASSGRHRIAQDYGVSPRVAHIQPLSREDAAVLIRVWAPAIAPATILDELDENGLDELYGNPLTLRLLTSVAAAGGGLPKRKAELFERACALLVREENPAHGDAAAAVTRPENLLIAAGEMFSALLLSGDIGVSTRAAHHTPPGFAALAAFDGPGEGRWRRDVVGTRLFRGEGAGLFIPVHRVTAEFLGAQALAGQLAAGLSPRRLSQLFVTEGGIPTALRGLHAWMAHFNPDAARTCIDADPYGVLRYGDTERLSLPLARQLLARLEELAEEDPYFRADDWSRHAASGLVRMELADDLIRILTSKTRRFHLTSLLLDAIRGMPVASRLTPSLIDIVFDETATETERRRALEVLYAGEDAPPISGVLARLLSADTEDARQLGLRAAQLVRGAGLSDAEVAEAYLRSERVTGPSALLKADDDHHQTIGTGEALARALPPERAPEVLDEVARQSWPTIKKATWSSRNGVRDTVRELIAVVANQDLRVEPLRFWRWVRLLDDDYDRADGDDAAMAAWVAADPAWRLAVQWAAVTDSESDDSPWMPLSYVLPRTKMGLALNEADRLHHLAAIASAETVDEPAVELWSALIRTTMGPGPAPPALTVLAESLGDRQPALTEEWRRLTQPRDPDYIREAKAEQLRYRAKTIAGYMQARAKMEPEIDALRTGAARGLVRHIAKIYVLGATDLPRDVAPEERLEIWLGPELTTAAFAGFEAALKASDLPTARQVSEHCAERRDWYDERVVIAALVERVRHGRDLEDVPQATLEFGLAAWWRYADLHTKTVKANIGPILEGMVICEPGRREGFVRDMLTPQLAADVRPLSFHHEITHLPVLEPVCVKLGLEWLAAYPDVHVDTQIELVVMTLDGEESDLEPIVISRLEGPLSPELERFWLSCAYMLELPAFRDRVTDAAANDADFLFAARRIYRFRARRGPLSAAQLGFAVKALGPRWPLIQAGDDGWGESAGWSASDFLGACISDLTELLTPEATAVLDDLVAAAIPTWEERIAHARAVQIRKRRDAAYAPAALDNVLAVLSATPPQTIDDLRAYVVDQLTAFQQDVLRTETDDWTAFWSGDAPLSEELCRDRLVALLRGRFPAEIQLLPESLMPNRKRADIVALLRRLGVPVEIKGQWHPDLWDAGSLQLDALYADSWRAFGRGVYLVFWFGLAPGRDLPKHPDELAPPATPAELKAMLEARLRPEQRDRIDVVVLDVDGRDRRAKGRRPHK
jgi:hypothetical protein